MYPFTMSLCYFFNYLERQIVEPDDLGPIIISYVIGDGVIRLAG